MAERSRGRDERKMTEERPVSRRALVAAIIAAALVTAGLVGEILLWPHFRGFPMIFGFVFLYALIPGLILGVPILGYAISHDEFRWWTAAIGGALAGMAPGLIFLTLIANCTHNAVVLGVAVCTDGARNGEGWKLSGLLLAGVAGIGAGSGIMGYLVYRLFAGSPFAPYTPKAPPPAG